MAALEDPKHEKFAQEYCVDFNATKAAIRAGYAKRSAKQQGSRLMTKDDILVRVKELYDKEVNKLQMSPDRILRELSYLGSSDISEALDDNGNPLPIHQIPERLRRCISGFEMVEERDETGEATGHQVKKYKFYDKNTSLTTLAKIHKMLTDKVEHEHKVTLESFLGGTWPEDDQKGSSPKDKKK